MRPGAPVGPTERERREFGLAVVAVGFFVLGALWALIAQWAIVPQGSPGRFLVFVGAAMVTASVGFSAGRIGRSIGAKIRLRRYPPDFPLDADRGHRGPGRIP